VKRKVQSRRKKAGAAITLVVRRGALKRFHNLQQKTRELPVNVVWDERQSERRRTGAAATPVESRKSERRRAPATTWGIADFVVAVPAPRKKKAI
jgi:hypothetical protein